MIDRTRLVSAIAIAVAMTFAGAASADETGGKIVVTKEFAKLLDGTAPIPVVVTVALASADAVTAQLDDAATRGAAKAAIAATLDAAVAGLVPGKAVLKLTTSPRFATKLTTAEIKALATDPRVVAINYDVPVFKDLTQSIPQIQANTLQSAGGTGSGRTVAIIDDGAQRSHPFLGNRHIAAAEACFIAGTTGCPNGTGEQIGAGAAEAKPGQSHGTHVAGIAIGRNTLAGNPRLGVARAARYIPINVFGPFSGTAFSNLDRAFEHVEDLVLTNNNTHRIASVNMSIGGGGSSGQCDDNFPNTKAILTRLRNRDVPVMISAGNGGGNDFMGAPGCISTAISVSSVSKTSVPSTFTDINETTDLFAPGGEFGDCIVSSVQTNSYAAFCGTSMASPHVAGAFAALKQLFPAAKAPQILAALQQTGQLIQDTIHKKPLIKLERARLFLLNPVPPSNDAFARALTLPINASLSTNNAFATRQTGERRHVVSTDDKTLWYKFRATGGLVTIDTLGSDFDTVLAVYDETTLETLSTPVASNNNVSATQLASRVSFNTVANRLYYVAVGSLRASTYGHVVISTVGTVPPPPNDNFAAARTLTIPAAGILSLTGSNRGSSAESGEPYSTATVWFRFRAAAAGTWQIDTNGSNYDTKLGVYRGTAVNALTAIAQDDDGGDGVNSLVRFNAVANTLYYVQVGGFNGSTGNFTLRIANPSNSSASVDLVATRR
ncbi:S8 family serine peptidase [Methylobrevis albus]|uniref:S8 family serine peptidase n=1 Tax=Methylobrevis albus TaxID=2793297 RepID=A0A931I2S4_9HYPH|nr:S8 family serine peptidase [Methylobrevis albus]MBH0237861.1 S8 family serine peptidase [Methylobrevis albus]